MRPILSVYRRKSINTKASVFDQTKSDEGVRLYNNTIFIVLVLTL